MNWKSIIATAIITGVVTVATGMLLFRWQTKEPKLTYNSIRSIPFDDTSNKLFIQQIEFENSGNKPAEEVVLIISFTDEIIQKSKITIDDAIPHQKTCNDKSIQLTINNLNPGEGANVSVLYQSPKTQSSGATISLRAKGITGKMIGLSQQDTQEGIWIMIALVAAYAGIFSTFLLSKKRRSKLSPLSLLFGGNEQKNVLASILSMFGYPEKARDYLSYGARRQYWVEADLLAAEALLGDKKLKKNTIRILNVISKNPILAKSSKAIIYYNIARLLKDLKAKNEKVETFLELAKNLDKKEIEDRLSYDPLFLSKPKSE